MAEQKKGKVLQMVKCHRESGAEFVIEEVEGGGLEAWVLSDGDLVWPEEVKVIKGREAIALAAEWRAHRR